MTATAAGRSGIVDKRRHYSPSGLHSSASAMRTRIGGHGTRPIWRLPARPSASSWTSVSRRTAACSSRTGSTSRCMGSRTRSCAPRGIRRWPKTARPLTRDPAPPGYRGSRARDDVDRLFASFLALGRVRRPWVTYVDDGFLWLEEYPEPSRSSDHTANGFTRGVRDLRLLPVHPRPGRTADPECEPTTMRHHVADFRVPGGVSKSPPRGRRSSTTTCSSGSRGSCRR